MELFQLTRRFLLIVRRRHKVKVLTGLVATQLLLMYYAISFQQQYPDSTPIHELFRNPFWSRNRYPAADHKCFNSSRSENRPNTWGPGQLGSILMRNKTLYSESVLRIDSVLNIKRLVLVTTHLINTKTKTNPLCVKWWTNPLTTSMVSRASTSNESIDWSLTFDLEPGRVPVHAILRQSTKPQDQEAIHLQTQQEFALVSVHVHSAPGIEDLENLCLCQTGLKEAKEMSDAARREWNKTDPELRHWPLDSSFMITDYVNYLDYSYFLVNPRNYNNVSRDVSFCGPTVRAIIPIHSAPRHWEMRAAIRTTYGSWQNLEKFHARLVFFLGTSSNLNTQSSVNKEIQEFGDIVVANFVDAYHNMTLKQLSVYHWIYLHCARNSQPMPELIVKVDDDFMLNVGAALQLADANPNALYLGQRMYPVPASRLQRSFKWYIPKYVYPLDMYNAYLSGSTVILRSGVILRILQASLTVPFFHIDDSYIAGVLRKVANIVAHRTFLIDYNRTPPDECGTKLKINSPYYVNGTNDLLDQWSKLIAPLPKNCSLSKMNFTALEFS